MDTLDGDSEMAARISSYELALHAHAKFRPPKPWTCPRKSRRPESCYGWSRNRPTNSGTRCLLARRLVDNAGVRFIQLYSGGGPVSIQWTPTKTWSATTRKCAV
jgi:hypothetical protein